MQPELLAPPEELVPPELLAPMSPEELLALGAPDDELLGSPPDDELLEPIGVVPELLLTSAPLLLFVELEASSLPSAGAPSSDRPQAATGMSAQTPSNQRVRIPSRIAAVCRIGAKLSSALRSTQGRFAVVRCARSDRVG